MTEDTGNQVRPQGNCVVEVEFKKGETKSVQLREEQEEHMRR